MRGKQIVDEWSQPPPGFGHVLFNRTDPAVNARRYYQVNWEPTMFDAGAVVRTYGRKGGWQQVALTPCASLAAAWPLIRAIIRMRLRHKYAIVAIDQRALFS